MQSNELEQVIYAEMQQQRADALEAYRRIMKLPEPGPKDRLALIEAMRILGKTSADLRRDMDALKTYAHHRRIIDRNQSPEFACQREEARKAADDYKAESERILAGMREEHAKLYRVVADLEEETRNARDSTDAARQMEGQFWEVLGFPKPEHTEYVSR
jgi:hypothetical protein